MLPSVEELSEWNGPLSCQRKIVGELVLHGRSNIVFTSSAFIVTGSVESAGGAKTGGAVTGRGAGVGIGVGVFSTGCMDNGVGFEAGTTTGLTIGVVGQASEAERGFAGREGTSSWARCSSCWCREYHSRLRSRKASRQSGGRSSCCHACVRCLLGGNCTRHGSRSSSYLVSSLRLLQLLLHPKTDTAIHSFNVLDKIFYLTGQVVHIAIPHGAYSH